MTAALLAYRCCHCSRHTVSSGGCSNHCYMHPLGKHWHALVLLLPLLLAVQPPAHLLLVVAGQQHGTQALQVHEP